ncbi:MAG: hypothetical protein KIT14_07745 [bacterium]|nr:hypothetical protein [bacterium]
MSAGHLPLERLVDGVLHTLRTVVAPALDDRYARGQLFAVLDLLHNLRERIAIRPELLAAEAESAAEALDAAVMALGSVPPPLAAALAAVPAEPLAARVAALRAAVVAAFTVLPSLPSAVAAPAHAALAAHLGGQAMRDVAVLKPSLLEEISKG